LAEYCTVLPALRVPVQALFDAWQMYCDETGRSADTRELFGRNLKSVIPHIRYRRTTGMVPFYEGVGLTAAATEALHAFLRRKRARDTNESG
jgi:hypothetical protein